MSVLVPRSNGTVQYCIINISGQGWERRKSRPKEHRRDKTKWERSEKEETAWNDECKVGVVINN
jgi:hypothetical protein